MNLTNGKASMSTASSSASWKAGDVVSDQFPVGLRVLVVDDDPTCLLILEKMLRACRYEGMFVVVLLQFVIFCICFVSELRDFVFVFQDCNFLFFLFFFCLMKEIYHLADLLSVFCRVIKSLFVRFGIYVMK